MILMKKCFLDYLKIKSNKKSLIILLILLAINMILAVDKWIIMLDHIIKIGFYKDDKFSIDLFWSAMNSIFTLLGFIGIIIVMKHDDNVRIKQNIIDSKRQLFISSQNDYENNMRALLKKIDPIVILDNCINMNNNDVYRTIFSNQLYISNLKSNAYLFYSFYNYDIFKNRCQKRDEFLEMYYKFVDQMNDDQTIVNEC